MKIPQADDVTKIMDLPLAIADKIDNSKLLAKTYGFDERQSNYYLEAAEILGLVSRRQTRYVLTEDGRKYLLMDISQRKLMLIRRMVTVPIVSRLVAELLVSDNRTISKEEVERVIQESSKVGGSTVPRRAQTLIAWFRWLGEETGVFHIDADSVKIVATERTVQ